MKPYQVKHNGRIQWCVRWTQAGRERFVYDDNKRLAQEKQLRRVAKIENEESGVNPEPMKPAREKKPGTRGNPTVSQAVERWLAGSESIGAASRTKYRNNYRNHLEPLIGELAVKKLTTGQMETALQTVKSSQVGDSAYYHLWTEMNSCMNWLAKRKVIRTNPMRLLDKPVRSNKISVKDDKNIERWENTVIGIVNWLADEKNPYHRYFGLVLALTLGLRRAEVLGITVEMISRSEFTLKVCNQLEMRAGGAYIKPSTKGRAGEFRGRLIPLPRQHYLAFKNEMDGRDEDAGLINVEVDGAVVDRQHLLFIREDGRPYTYNNLRDIWIEVQEEYKGRVLHDYSPLSADERIRLHGNRHIACSLLASQGVPLQTIQAILGHLTPQMTMHYTHYATRQLRGTTQAYGELMFNDNAKNFVRESVAMDGE